MKQNTKAKENGTSDCIACLLRPVLWVGCISGVSPLKAKCAHLKKPSRITSFSKSKTLFVISVVLLFPMIANTVFVVQDTLATDGFNEKVFIGIEITFFLISAVVGINSLLGTNKKLSELNGLSVLITNRRYYGFESLIDKKMTISFRWVSYGITVLTVTTITYFYSCVLLPKNNSNTALMLLNRFVNVFINIQQFMFGYQVVLSILLYRILFVKCFNRIKDALLLRLNNMRSSEITENVTFEENLKRLKLFYMNLITNYKQLNSFIQNVFLIDGLIIIAMLTFNSYLVLLIYSNVVEENPLWEMRCYGSVLAIPIFLFLVEHVHGMSQDIISFLFKYPISKLSLAEAAQVEMLIITLTKQKPALKATDIVTIDARLLASICGTVVTYVLVVLQFRPAWSR